MLANGSSCKSFNFSSGIYVSVVTYMMCQLSIPFNNNNNNNNNINN